MRDLPPVPTDAVLVLTTLGDPEAAREIARGLVEARLSACVNILGNLSSIYRWEGRIVEDSECLMLIKTRRERIEKLQEFLTARHPYDLPEFLGFAALTGSPAYLSWLWEATEPDESGDR